MVFLSMEQEDVASEAAFEILDNQPGWASVQERLSKANVRYLRKSKETADLQERRDAALKNLEFQARTYLELVSDSATADAYCGVLPLMVRGAYVNYCGAPPQIAIPVSEESRSFERDIELRFRQWTSRAYRRAQTKPRANGPTSTERAAHTTPGAVQAKYRTFTWCGQTRYQCPYCERDHYDLV